MRGLRRIYVVFSCGVFSSLVGGAAFLCAAAWIVPEWLQGASRDLAAAIERFAEGGGPREGAGGSPFEGGLVHATLRQGGDRGDLPTPERHPGRDTWPASTSPTSQETEAAAKLTAWESLRPSLRALLVKEGPEAEAALAADLDIRLAAPLVALRLDRMARSVPDSRATPGPKDGERRPPDSGVLVNLLLDERSMTDEEALSFLTQYPERETSRVIERLSRIAPQRAARLLRGLAAIGGQARSSGG
jgi:hypothetical protein